MGDQLRQYGQQPYNQQPYPYAVLYSPLPSFPGQITQPILSNNPPAPYLQPQGYGYYPQQSQQGYQQLPAYGQQPGYGYPQQPVYQGQPPQPMYSQPPQPGYGYPQQAYHQPNPAYGQGQPQGNGNNNPIYQLYNPTQVQGQAYGQPLPTQAQRQTHPQGQVQGQRQVQEEESQYWTTPGLKIFGALICAGSAALIYHIATADSAAEGFDKITDFAAQNPEAFAIAALLCVAALALVTLAINQIKDESHKEEYSGVSLGEGLFCAARVLSGSPH